MMRTILILVGALLLLVATHEVEARGLRAKVRNSLESPSNKPSRLQKLVVGLGLVTFICFGNNCEISTAASIKNDAPSPLAEETPLPLVQERAATIADRAADEYYHKVVQALVDIEAEEGGDAILDPILRSWWDKHGGVGKIIRAGLVVGEREPLTGMLAKLTEDEITAGVRAGLSAAVATGKRHLVFHFDWVTDLHTFDAAIQQAKELHHDKIRSLLSYYKKRIYALSLHDAAERGDLDAVKRLLPHTSSIDSALQLALQAEQLQVVKLLLARGASPDAGLVSAIKNGNLTQAKLMLTHGAERHDRALRLAVAANKPQIAKLLVAHGADPNVGLLKASTINNYALAKLFIQFGADKLDEALINAISAFTPRAGMQLIDLLLANGAKVEVEDKRWLEKMRRIYHNQKK